MAEAARSGCMMLLYPTQNAGFTYPYDTLCDSGLAERTNLSEIMSIIESYHTGHLSRRGPLRVTMS